MASSLFAHVSCSGKIEQIAQLIHAVTNGVLLSIRPVQDCPHTYQELLAQARVEIHGNCRLPLQTGGDSGSRAIESAFKKQYPGASVFPGYQDTDSRIFSTRDIELWLAKIGVDNGQEVPL